MRTLSTYKYTINERGVKFRRLCVLCIFNQILIFTRPQYTLKLKKTHGSSGMHEPACMLAAAAAAAGRCWLLLLLLAAASGCCPAAASSSSSNQQLSSNQQPAAAASSSQQQSSSSQQQPAWAWLLHGCCMGMLHGHGCCMGMLLLQNRDAWCMACCCFKTGMHGAWHVASAAAAAACVRGRLRDRHHIRADTSAQTQAWRIEFLYRNIREESTRTKG